jgi:four helix bundle protein
MMKTKSKQSEINKFDSSEIGEKLAQEMFKKLGFDSKGRPIRERGKSSLGEVRRFSTSSSYRPPKTSYNPPFRIRALEKTHRQSPRGKAYTHSPLYRNSVILRLLAKIFTTDLDPIKYRYLISQIESETRSIIANIREGYLRPSSTEYSTFLGFSHGSLEEFRGDVEDAKDDGLLPSRPGSTLASIGIELKPPTSSYLSPKKYLDSLKRKIGEIKREKLTYEIFIELVNKTDYLLKRAVEGLDKKIIADEEKKLNQELKSHWRKNW